VTCHAIAIADRVGVFDALEEHGSLRISDWGGDRSKAPLAAVMSLLREASIVTESGSGVFTPGPAFADCVSRKALFTWFFHASASVLISGPDLIREVIASPPARDGALIGSTMGDLGRRHIDKALFSMVSWRDFECVLDVGCGDASRLQRITERFGINGVGLELSEAALRAARDRLNEGSSSLALVQGDALAMDFDKALRDRVDILIMSLLAHDLLPEKRAADTLHMWKTRLPNLKRMLICETVRADEGLKGLSVEVPQLGYEFLHSLMGIEVETDATWRRIFSASGWELVQTTKLDVPSNTMVYVCDRS